MILRPRPGSESVDRRLEQLYDPDLTQQLRKSNPELYARRSSKALECFTLTVVAIVSLIAGYFMETSISATSRNHAAVPVAFAGHAVRVHVHHHVALRHAIAAKPVAAPRRGTLVIHQTTAPESVHAVALEAQPNAQLRAHASAVAQAQTQARAQAEERFWLRAQAQARAQDRARAAKSAAVVAAAAAPAPNPPVADTVNNPPPVPAPPTGNTLPRVPIGGRCHHGGIRIGGHGIGTSLLNFVLQSVHVPKP